MHPGLAEHPFVQHVEALGIEVPHEGITNAYGYPGARGILCLSEAGVGELIETQHFTIRILCCHRAGIRTMRAGKGYITIGLPPYHARAGRSEPDPASSASFLRPACAAGHGSEFWGINIGPMSLKSRLRELGTCEPEPGGHHPPVFCASLAGGHRL
jgi:hypothetical protein